MSTWIWVLIAIGVVIVVAGVLWSALRARRTKGLRERFGPEYDRVAADAPTRREAEGELQERERRRDELELRPLSPTARERYVQRWRDVQAAFVDDPNLALHEADDLVTAVMRERGYPMDDFEQRAADISVDHPQLVDNYRRAHHLTVASGNDDFDTEQQRQAMVHFRALFDELLETRTAETV
jgi:hypothetical protein